MGFAMTETDKPVLLSIDARGIATATQVSAILGLYDPVKAAIRNLKR